MKKTGRLKCLRQSFDRRKIDAYLVTKDVNIAYLTGFPSSESWLLVGPRRASYLTDFRYVQQARRQLAGLSVKMHRTSVFESLVKEIEAMQVKRLGFDSRHLSLAQYSKLRRACPKSISLIRSDHCVERLREVKDRDEIRKIRRALVIHKQANSYIKRMIKPNIKEGTCC